MPIKKQVTVTMTEEDYDKLVKNGKKIGVDVDQGGDAKNEGVEHDGSERQILYD